MRLISNILTLLIVLTPPAYATSTLTLDEAVAAALKKHPLAAEARENVAAAEARRDQAYAPYYPQISLAADWSRGRSFLAPLEGVRETEAGTAGAYLRQTIYDFGRTSGAAEAAGGDRDASREALSATQQEIVLRVKGAYFLLLAAEREVIAVRETVRAREEVSRQAQEFFSQGIRPRVDVARAEANLFAARTLLIRSENNRDIARLELAAAMGSETPARETLSEPPPLTVHLSELAPLKEMAFSRRPEMRRLQSLHASARAAAKAARSSHLPVISATASVGYADRALPPDHGTWGVGIGLTVPVFSGLATVGQEREAAAALRGVEAQQQNLRLGIGREVESAWLGVREAQARIASTDKEVAAARENSTLATERYREGVGTIIEVTDAQAQALDAETASIRALYDTHMALARLDRAAGDGRW